MILSFASRKCRCALKLRRFRAIVVYAVLTSKSLRDSRSMKAIGPILPESDDR
jgi:hypothetical protein